MINDPRFYALAVPAVLLTGISKGGLSGLGALAVPLLAMALPPGQAAGVMLPILCFMDLFGLWAYRKAWSRDQLGVLLSGALIGIVLGALTFDRLDDNAVRIAIGGNALLFTLMSGLRRVRNPGKLEQGTQPKLLKGVFWASLSGFASYIAHAGGPPLLMYLLPQRIERILLAGTMTVYFALVNFLKLIPYLWFGQLDLTNFTQALILTPLAPLGIWIGYWLIRRIDNKNFYRVCHALLLIAGAKLVFDGLKGFGLL